VFTLDQVTCSLSLHLRLLILLSDVSIGHVDGVLAIFVASTYVLQSVRVPCSALTLFLLPSVL